jgi:hypothetical protein
VVFVEKIAKGSGSKPVVLVTDILLKGPHPSVSPLKPQLSCWATSPNSAVFFIIGNTRIFQVYPQLRELGRVIISEIGLGIVGASLNPGIARKIVPKRIRRACGMRPGCRGLLVCDNIRTR